MRLNCTDNYVLAAFPASARFVQHAESLSNAGRVTQDNFEVSSTDGLFLGPAFA